MIREKCACGAQVAVKHGEVGQERDTTATWRATHRHGDEPGERDTELDAYVETAVPHQPHAPLGFGLPPRPTTGDAQ